MLLLLDNYDSFTWNLVHRFAEIDPALVPGRELRVVRNDEVSVERIEALNAGVAPGAIVISPGPCTPNEAGISNEVVRRFAGRVPILGVCLGHQCLASAFGLAVVRHHARHGKTSQVHHDGRGVFAGLPSPFEAMRYHSLVVPWDWERDAPGGSTEPKGGSPRPGVSTTHDASSAPSRGLPSLGSAGASTLVGRWRASAWAFDDLPDGTRARVVMGLRFEHAASSPNRAPLEGVQFHPESFMTSAGLELLRNFASDAGLVHEHSRAS